MPRNPDRVCDTGAMLDAALERFAWERDRLEAIIWARAAAVVALTNGAG